MDCVKKILLRCRFTGYRKSIFGPPPFFCYIDPKHKVTNVAVKCDFSESPVYGLQRKKNWKKKYGLNRGHRNWWLYKFSGSNNWCPKRTFGVTGEHMFFRFFRTARKSTSQRRLPDRLNLGSSVDPISIQQIPLRCRFKPYFEKKIFLRKR